MPFIGNQPALSYTSFAKQDFTTSATTSYTLNNPVTNENELALFINFVRQEPTTAYTASGTSLTLTSATASSDDMYCVFLGKAVQTVNPPSGSVGASQISDGSIALGKLSATGTKDATTFLRGDNTFNAPPLGGITQADVWRINSDQSISSATHTTLASNWERADDATFAYIGGGMSQSSGKFTFPATGIYYITFTLYAFDTGSMHYYATKIMGSTDDGSSYDQLASADNTIANVGGSNYNTSTVSCFFDCNNTSSDKVAFRTYGSEAFGLHGDNNSNTSYATFIRLGDT
jgi:hypothetical protein